MASPEIVVLAEAPRKKARKQNFSPTEIATLTEKVEENLAILQSKLRNSITNQKKMNSGVKLLIYADSVPNYLQKTSTGEKSQCDKYLVKWCESVVSCCASTKISS